MVDFDEKAARWQGGHYRAHECRYSGGQKEIADIFTQGAKWQFEQDKIRHEYEMEAANALGDERIRKLEALVQHLRDRQFENGGDAS
jgi:hypothetical protein